MCGQQCKCGGKCPNASNQRAEEELETTTGSESALLVSATASPVNAGQQSTDSRATLSIAGLILSVAEES